MKFLHHFITISIKNNLLSNQSLIFNNWFRFVKIAKIGNRVLKHIIDLYNVTVLIWEIFAFWLHCKSNAVPNVSFWNNFPTCWNFYTISIKNHLFSERSLIFDNWISFVKISKTENRMLKHLIDLCNVTVLIWKLS